jgi:predicted secreted protein
MRGARGTLIAAACTLVLLLVLAACGSSSHTTQGTPTFTDAKRPIVVRVGQRFHVEVPSTPGTGYQWRVGQTQPALVEQAGARYVASKTTRVGAAGRQVFDFRAKAKGEGALAVVSVGPGRDASVGKTEQFRVTVR